MNLVLMVKCFVSCTPPAKTQPTSVTLVKLLQQLINRLRVSDIDIMNIHDVYG